MPTISYRRSVVPVFDRVARVYNAALLQRLMYRPGHDEVVRRLRAAGARRVVDVGCGTGILAARIHDELHPEVVYGADPSTGMLEKAAARSSAVEWLEAPADDLPLPDGAVDAVTSTAAFPFFDQPASLAEFHRVLAPGGRVIITHYGALTRGVAAASARLAKATIGNGRWPTGRQVRADLEAAGFESVHQRRVRRPFRWAVPELITTAVRP